MIGKVPITFFAIEIAVPENRGNMGVVLMILRLSPCLVMVVAAISYGCLQAQIQPSIVNADGVRFHDAKLAQIQSLVNSAIASGEFPGCVICFGRQNQIAFRQAYGHRQVQPVRVPMTVDTVFDLASITKPVATATSVMVLIDRGKLRLSDRIADHFPKFAVNGKDLIIVKHLLIHQSGLIPDNSLSDYVGGPELAWQRICKLGLVCEVGTEFRYSDVNFIVLAKLVEQISGRDIHQFSEQAIFQPLGMSDSGFLPAEPLRRRAAVTEQRDGVWLQGKVHDPRAHRLGGIAGHAGLFSTADDLAIYASMMIGRGALATEDQPVVVLSELSWKKMTDAYAVSSGKRGLGWDKQTAFSSNKGSRLTASAFGHGGFTGTVLWIDPEQDLFFIFLCSRLHPDGKGRVNRLAGQLLDIVVDAMDR
ncbi:MAG: serine hydrolase domain-containing protein [Fuerstiella sp.]